MEDLVRSICVIVGIKRSFERGDFLFMHWNCCPDCAYFLHFDHDGVNAPI
jgi:hypothetical protein